MFLTNLFPFSLDTQIQVIQAPRSGARHRNLNTPPMEQQGKHKTDQEDNEQDFCNKGSRSRYDTKAKNARNDCNK